MKQGWQNIIVLITLAGLLSTVSAIKAAFSTSITSKNNLFALGTLDVDLKTTSDTDFPATLFNQSDFQPSDTDPQSIRLKKAGTLDFKYNFEFEKTSGSDTLCSALELKADFNGTTYYSGSLSSFTLPTALTLTNDNDWNLTLALNDSNQNLQNLDCNFNINITAYQVNSDSTWGFTSQESFSNTIHSGDWTAPTSNAEPLPTYQNSNTFNVPFTATDSGGLVDTIDLYFSYQSGAFTKYTTHDIAPDSTPASGSIPFTATNGDGLYKFYTSATDDSSNQESLVGKSTESETTLDTIAPATTIKVSSGKTIGETVTNPGFEFGLTGWTTKGDVNFISSDAHQASAYDGTYMARLGTPEDYAGETSGNPIWSNKISQQLNPGAKNLSFNYNLYSFDTTGFDSPAVYVKLNDYAVFNLTASEIDTGGNPNQTGWQQASFNLEGITDPVLEIIFYSGNTNDDQNQSWLYLDNITTSQAQVNDSETFTLSATDSLSGVYKTSYSLNGITWFSNQPINATSLESGTNTIYFKSSDNAGNQELAKSRIIVKNNQAPEEITDLYAIATSKNTIDIDWTTPGDNGGGDQVTLYDIRYSDTEILDDTDFNNATKVLNPPAPKLPGEFEVFTVSGLNSNTTYYFAIKSGDSVNNWSSISNSPSDTTLDDISDPWINPGDVVINELMWMGTSGSTSDQYLELRNTTDQDIDISDWVIQGAGFAGSDLTIPSGSIITAFGYFLITNLNPSDPLSKLHDTNVTPDWITSSLTLLNTDAQYTLLDNTSFTIDVADDGLDTPFAGQNYYSMERNATPGDGTAASNWHTIFDDSIEMQNYWDSGSSEKGTPGGRNLSQTPTLVTTLNFTLDSTHTTASFSLKNITQFTSLDYTLTYTSLTGDQGIVGTKDLENDQITIDNLVLGTCSTNGNCLYHQNPDNFKLEVTLNGPITRTLTKEITL